MILALCGPPAVGKTTVAYLLQERLQERGIDCTVLDSDEFSTDTYERMFDRVEGAGGNWILAGTFYKQRWQAHLRRFEDAILVYLRADLDTCLERNRRWEAPIEERAVHIIYREFHDPDADVTVGVAGRSPDEVTDRILAVLDRPASGGTDRPDCG